MGYYATIILIGAFLIGGMVIIRIQDDTRDADLELAAHQFKVLAREAAHTGLNATVRKLADNTGMWTSGTYFTRVPYTTGSFSVDVVRINPDPPPNDTVDVIARGFSGNAEHVIFARYERGKDTKGIPPAFKYAIVSDFYMQYSGNMLVASVDATRNASIHTNDDLDLRGNSFRVEGFGTYTGTVRISAAAEDNFVPPYDYNGDDPNHHWAPEVTIPAIDSLKLKNLAQSGQGMYLNVGGWSSTTPFVINGNATPVLDFTNPGASAWVGGGGPLNYTCADCGTPEKPAVVFVDGPLDITRRVRVVGNAIFISTGQTRVIPNGHGGGFFGRLNGDGETEVTLASLKGVKIGHGGGNACMGLGPRLLGGANKQNQHCRSGNNGADGYTHGVSVYAEDRVEMLGTPVIVGGVVADETYMDNGGNPSIIYASPNEGTIDAGFENIVPIGPILIAFSEF